MSTGETQCRLSDSQREGDGVRGRSDILTRLSKRTLHITRRGLFEADIGVDTLLVGESVADDDESVEDRAREDAALEDETDGVLDDAGASALDDDERECAEDSDWDDDTGEGDENSALGDDAGEGAGNSVLDDDAGLSDDIEATNRSEVTGWMVNRFLNRWLVGRLNWSLDPGTL